MGGEGSHISRKMPMKLIKKLRWQILIIVLALIVIGFVLWGQQAEPVLAVVGGADRVVLEAWRCTHTRHVHT